jgi:glycosyltransferase involved in cell wall biosynthesis
MEFIPFFSVLITAYNRERYIAQAIESVLASTFTDYEIIIVDDCSKDNTLIIAKYYESIDSRVKVYVNNKNVGDYPNRNIAASYAKGKYLKYIDADDMIYPWGLEIIYRTILAYPNIAFCLDSIEQDSDKIFPLKLSPLDAYEREYFNSSIFSKAPTSATIKSSIFKRYGGFSGKQHVGDFEFWHLLAIKNDLILLPHGIIWSRSHEEQESNANRTDSFVLFKYLIVSLEYLNHSENPLPKAKRIIAIKFINKRISRSILKSFFLELDFKKAIKKIEFSNISPILILFYAFKKI